MKNFIDDMLRFDFVHLQKKLRSREINLSDVIEVVYARIDACGDPNIWTHIEPKEKVLQRIVNLEGRSSQIDLPLYGLPFSVKDNIDVSGVPTTAGCTDWSYLPSDSSPAVEDAIKAGAIFIGKNNLDQFANGLVGIRCPRGACLNAINPDYVPGGSSSGSGVAVARGLVSFSLGTDTGGSGRVPAALNNVVGLKPTCGTVSSRGLFYANRSLDCVTVFAMTADDAFSVYEVIRGFDAHDPFSRIDAGIGSKSVIQQEFRFAIPNDDSQEFFGDEAAREEFAKAVNKMQELGGQVVRIPFAPFFEAGRLLFEGAWIVERWMAAQQAIDSGTPQLNAATKAVLDSAKRFVATDIFRDHHQLMDLRRQCADLWRDADFLVVPTVPTIPKVSEVEANPVKMNARNGYYTYFANLLDLCGIAVPSGFRADGLPTGICILARAFEDKSAFQLGRRYQTFLSGRLGATSWQI